MPRKPADSTLELPFPAKEPNPAPRTSLRSTLLEFREFGKATEVVPTAYVPAQGDGGREILAYVNEYWTAKQRQAHSLHEISYRACFKPQLPRFFIQHLTRPGEIVYDPFMGRGTTILEAALLGRSPLGCDVNPLSTVLVRPRLNPPLLDEVSARLKTIDFTAAKEVPDEFQVFYHPETLREIVALKEYLFSKQDRNALDPVDEWIRMVAINRLTGHSSGFFSVYTLPPNQAVSLKSQARINALRKQVPPRRSVPDLIRKKSKVLLSDCDQATRRQLASVRDSAALLTSPCSKTPQIRAGSVGLIVTSPPFLNVVDYATDNWLRCWFLGIDAKKVKITMARKLDEWQAAMTQAMQQFRRVLKPGGHLAFEVGEVFGGSTPLEQAVVPCGEAAGLEPLLVMINDQKFTKTANCWGVDNMSKGTNTNRIVLFRKS